MSPEPTARKAGAFPQAVSQALALGCGWAAPRDSGWQGGGLADGCLAASQLCAGLSCHPAVSGPPLPRASVLKRALVFGPEDMRSG